MKKLFTIWLAAAVCACGQTRKPEAASGPPVYKLPEVPAIYSDPQARANYLSQHYWDSVDFADTAWVSHKEAFEKALPDYLAYLSVLPAKAVKPSVDGLLDRASVQPALFDMVTELLDKYLYDPNSPMRNEDSYIPVLQYLIASEKVDSLEKIRPRHRLALAMKNRPGAPAADFAYTLADGRGGRLSGIKSPYTLIFFYNPECHGCEEIRTALETAQPVSDLIEEGRLKILALYVDEDEALWRRHLDEIPAAWISARDAKGVIRESELYDMRAIPTIYLLDADKTVLLKDAMPEQAVQYLARLR